jgi:hypothetical protein
VLDQHLIKPEKPKLKRKLKNTKQQSWMQWRNWKHPECTCQSDAENNITVMCNKGENELYCGVFTSCKNCNFETRSRDYATVDEAVFSPCRYHAVASLVAKRQL